MFFFFQAEDGIRDVAVTGVQTCALPIFSEATWRKPLALITAAFALPTRTMLPGSRMLPIMRGASSNTLPRRMIRIQTQRALTNRNRPHLACPRPPLPPMRLARTIVPRQEHATCLRTMRKTPRHSQSLPIAATTSGGSAYGGRVCRGSAVVGHAGHLVHGRRFAARRGHLGIVVRDEVAHGDAHRARAK